MLKQKSMWWYSAECMHFSDSRLQSGLTKISSNDFEKKFNYFQLFSTALMIIFYPYVISSQQQLIIFLMENNNGKYN